MHATGTLYLGKARPVADTAPDGEFRLTLLLIDNLGGNEKESYRVRWSGPQAQAFWQARSAELVPGAIVHAELERIRATAGATYPPIAELRARVVQLEIVPKRLPGERVQLSNQEHSEPVYSAYAR